MWKRGHKPAWRIVLAVGVLLVSATGSVHAAESLIGRPAPEFSRVDLNHERVDLAAYRGKVVLLNFWATWCAPCRIEMPRFAAWQRRYGPQGLQVIGVSIDDSEKPVRALVDELHLDYPVVMGDVKLAELYGGVMGVPVTFLIDRRGRVRTRFDGGPATGTLEDEVKKLLAAAP